MKRVLMLTGDVNLMNVRDPKVPFALIGDTLRKADVLFGNLECCFYEPGAGHSVEREGFYAPLASAQALAAGNFHAIGNANNVNYGEEAIRSSLRELERVGIPCTGAGVNERAARARRRHQPGPALRLPAADLGLLAHRARGDRDLAGGRGADRPHGVRAAAPHVARRCPARESSRPSAGHRHLGRCQITGRLHG